MVAIAKATGLIEVSRNIPLTNGISSVILTGINGTVAISFPMDTEMYQAWEANIGLQTLLTPSKEIKHLHGSTACECLLHVHGALRC